MWAHHLTFVNIYGSSHLPGRIGLSRTLLCCPALAKKSGKKLDTQNTGNWTVLPNCFVERPVREDEFSARLLMARTALERLQVDHGTGRTFFSRCRSRCRKKIPAATFLSSGCRGQATLSKAKLRAPCIAIAYAPKQPS